MHVTVIGAGVAGLACAVELAERGATVEVIDRGEALGSSSCSWYAGGMLAPWCELESAEPLVAKLGSESIAWWGRRFPGAGDGRVGATGSGAARGGTGLPAGTVLNGSLVVAHGRDSGELAQFSRRTERFEWVDGDAIAALEPDLAGRFNKALFFKDEGHLDPARGAGGTRQPAWRVGSAGTLRRKRPGRECTDECRRARDVASYVRPFA